MLLSMTGFGRSTQTFSKRSVTVLVRSVNSKTTDVRFRIPNQYREREAELRKVVLQHAERGKLEVNLEIASDEADDGTSINRGLFKSYYRQLRDLQQELMIPESSDLVQSIMRIQNVVTPSIREVSREEFEQVKQTLVGALDNLQNFRRTEGAEMARDLLDQIQQIETALNDVDPHEESRLERIRQRLRQNLETFLGKENVDENRFEQEIIFYLEKIDINEEKVRLLQHLKYFRAELAKPSTQKGRKLGFISQEIGREINTLGAKAYNGEIQKLVVTMKDALERIKEQLANVL